LTMYGYPSGALELSARMKPRIKRDVFVWPMRQVSPIRQAKRALGFFHLKCLRRMPLRYGRATRHDSCRDRLAFSGVPTESDFLPGLGEMRRS
jgi:hypothetical protein